MVVGLVGWRICLGGAGLKRWSLFAIWLILVGGVIVCADRGVLRGFFRWINGIPFGDKAGHVFLIGIMAHLLNCAMAGRTSGIGRSRWQMGGLIVAVVMTIEEISQIWIPSRTFDLGDLAANYVGILLAEWRARCATARRSATIDSGAES